MDQEKERALDCVKIMKGVPNKMSVGPILIVKRAARPEVDPFVVEKDDLRKWEWNGVLYLRNRVNHVWIYDADADKMGAYQGKYNYELDKMEEQGWSWEPIFHYH